MSARRPSSTISSTSSRSTAARSSIACASTRPTAWRAAAGPNDRATRDRRRVIKGTRWLLLKNRANVTKPADRVRLRELLAANRALFIVYVLKDDLKQLWRYRYPGAARRFWRAWYRRAMASRIPALSAFARNLGGTDRRRNQSLPLPAAHRAARRHQQQDQSPQAHGLRLPRRRLLLPENPRSVSRNSVKNQKKDTEILLSRRRALHRVRAIERRASALDCSASNPVGTSL